MIKTDPEDFGKTVNPWVAGGLLLAGCLVIWLLVIGILLILPKDATEPIAPLKEDLFPEDASERAEAALTVWRRFVEAESIELRLAEVKDPLRVAPLMHDYHQRREKPWPTMSKITKGVSGGSTSRRVILFAVESFKGDTYAASLEWTGERFVVDWESLVAYGTMDWFEFIESKPTDAQLLRAFLSPLKSDWQDPTLPSGSLEMMMEHRDGTDPVTLRIPSDYAAVVKASVAQPRTPVRVSVRWSQATHTFELVDFKGSLWSE